MTEPAPAKSPPASAAVRYIETHSAEELSSWLLDIFARQTWELAPEGLREPLPEQIQRLYDKLEEAHGKKLREAVLLAIRYWRPERNGLTVLVDLAFTVARLRAALAVPDLCHLLRMRHRVRGSNPDEIAYTRGHLTAVVRGFAPDPVVCDTFGGMLYEPSEDPGLALHLLLGLCECRATSYPEYLRRFCELRDNVKPIWSDEVVVGALVRTLALPTLIEGLPAIEGGTRLWFLGVLTPRFVDLSLPPSEGGGEDWGVDTLLRASLPGSGERYNVCSSDPSRWDQILSWLGRRDTKGMLSEIQRGVRAGG